MDFLDKVLSREFDENTVRSRMKEIVEIIDEIRRDSEHAAKKTGPLRSGIDHEFILIFHEFSRKVSALRYSRRQEGAADAEHKRTSSRRIFAA